MSVCVFIAADCPLPNRVPDADARWNMEHDYLLYDFDRVDIYSHRQYGVELEMHQYSTEAAKEIIDYIKKVLTQCDCVELWSVWLLDYWEYEDRPHICKQTISVDELSVSHIEEIYHAKNWVRGDDIRPWFYCTKVVRS